MIDFVKKIFVFIISIVLWIYWWIIAVFVLSFVVLISTFLPKKYYNTLVKITCAVLTYCVFLFPKLQGVKKEDIPYPVIYVANHVSFFDIFICGTVLPGYPRGLELNIHFKTPFYGWFLTKFGQVSVNPGSYKSLKEALNTISDKLIKKERNFLIMPEGHRTKNGSIEKFNTGAFNLSRKTGVPIVPVVFKNLFNHANKNKKLIPGIININILNPIYPDKFSTDDKMAEFTRKILINELNNKLTSSEN